MDGTRGADMYAIGPTLRKIGGEMLPGPWSAINFARADVSLRRVDELAVDQGRSKLIDVSGPR